MSELTTAKKHSIYIYIALATMLGVAWLLYLSEETPPRDMMHEVKTLKKDIIELDERLTQREDIIKALEGFPSPQKNPQQ